MSHSVSKIKQKIIALMLVLCAAATLIPTAFAEEYSPQSGGGFATLDENGGLLLVGTARIPSTAGSAAAVKFIYSDNLILNSKSAGVIKEKLKNCGITISQDDIVSMSDISDSGSEKAIFAVGSPSAPMALNSCSPKSTVQASFSALFPGYNFNITGYNSLNDLLDDSSNMTISDDGKTVTLSVVMGESYMDKVINNKTVTILMINSEYTYSFQSPKLTYSVDEFYVSDADIEEPIISSTTTSTSSSTTADSFDITTTSASLNWNADATPTLPAIVDDEMLYNTTTAQSSTTTATTEAAATKSTTAATTTITTTTTASTTTTATTTTTKTTATTTTTTTTASTPKTTVSTVPSTTTQRTVPSAITSTTQKPSVSQTAPTLPRTTVNGNGSKMAIVNTKRLSLNVRSGPGLNYMIVTVLPKGTYVTVLDDSDPNWYMIKTMGKIVGYSSSEYIRIM